MEDRSDNHKIILVKIAVALPVHKTFTYKIPEADFAPGKRVLVPFGYRRVTGYLLSRAVMPDASDASSPEIKSVIDVLDDFPLFSEDMIPFFQWMAEYYVHPIGDVIKTALPGGINTRECKALMITDEGRKALSGCILTPFELSVLTVLSESGLPMELKDLQKRVRKAFHIEDVKAMIRDKWVVEKLAVTCKTPKTAKESFVRINSDAPDHSRENLTRKALLKEIKEKGEIPVKNLVEIARTAPKIVDILVEKGYVLKSLKTVFRDPFGESIEPEAPPEPTVEQKTAVEIMTDPSNPGFKSFLLSGVTGSGKTEVYMRLVQNALDSGKTALVLVPEIALVSQTERRFRARFGECVAVMHSSLAKGEVWDQWLRALTKEARVVVGVRSAVFAPLTDLGVIIVDEEHDASYKQDGGLHYNARDMAVVRAKLSGCIAVFGSATPSVQTYFNVMNGKFLEVTLKKRIMERPLPEVSIVDLRKQKDMKGINRFFSQELIDAMKEALIKKEQVLLFLNRRGFANHPVCAVCGSPLKCKHCDISLTYHKFSEAYSCHYCGFSIDKNASCANCGSTGIMLLGMGTEKIEEALTSMFPASTVERLDRDAVTRKGSLVKILKNIRDRATDILIGTQMIAKGHDFPNITLVGILCADMSLNFPDFRASETTFQILAQVAGRAGRGEEPGRVILQTFNPEHYAVETARRQDFMDFYYKEIPFRQALSYPPYSRLALFKISGRDKDKTDAVAEQLGKAINDILNRKPALKDSVEVMGPIASPLSKIASVFRRQIILKSGNYKLFSIVYHTLASDFSAIMNHNEVSVTIDVDPYQMM